MTPSLREVSEPLLLECWPSFEITVRLAQFSGLCKQQVSDCLRVGGGVDRGSYQRGFLRQLCLSGPAVRQFSLQFFLPHWNVLGFPSSLFSSTLAIIIR